MSDETKTEAAESDVETSGPTADQVREAMKVVIDPEIGINIVDLGLVYDVGVEEGQVNITYTLTSMGCPIGPMIEQQIQAALSFIDGIDAVNSQIVFRPAWTPEMMSDEAKAALGYL